MAVLSDGVPHEGIRGVLMRIRYWLVCHEGPEPQELPGLNSVMELRDWNSVIGTL
jgi:hypothetical protein